MKKYLIPLSVFVGLLVGSSAFAYQPAAYFGSSTNTGPNTSIYSVIPKATLRITCGCKQGTDKTKTIGYVCNTSGVKSSRAPFYVNSNGKKIKVFVDIGTKLRYVPGGVYDLTVKNPGEQVKKWEEFYPMIKTRLGAGECGGMPFSPVIVGRWVGKILFMAEEIKWTIG